MLKMTGIKDIFDSAMNFNAITRPSFPWRDTLDYFHLCVESTKNYRLTLQVIIFLGSLSVCSVTIQQYGDILTILLSK